MRILRERLVDLFDINATIYVRIMFADVVQIHLWVLRRDGQPSRSHLVRRERCVHHRAFRLKLLIRKWTHDIDFDYGRRMAGALRLVIARRAPVRLLTMMY